MFRYIILLSFINSVFLPIPISSKVNRFSITIQSGPVALILFNLASVELTSHLNISVPSMFLYVTECSPLSWMCSAMFSLILLSSSSFSNINIYTLDILKDFIYLFFFSLPNFQTNIFNLFYLDTSC